MNYIKNIFPIKLIAFISFSILFFSCAKSTEQKSEVNALPYYDEATFTPHWFSADDSALNDFHKISSFQLVNQEGESISEKTFDEKIYITDFFFTICPGICPKMTKNMGVLQEEFLKDDEVLLLSHSVTPEMDSVSVLKKYAEEKGVISRKWHLATGTQEDIYKLGRQDYFVEEDLGLTKEADEFLHTENFVLIDKNQHIRGIYNGLNSASVSQLIKDVKTLQMEK
ncbi:MAG: SCO family protein [Saprospiraceae bacterium]